MTIHLFDTMAGATRELVPLEPGHIRIYTCGPTVYGPAHVGNFRTLAASDLLVRYLRYRGYHVTWVMNVTDIDDKIIKRAREEGIFGRRAGLHYEPSSCPTSTPSASLDRT